MGGLADTFGNPREVVLHRGTSKEVKLKAGRLTLRIMGEFERWCQDQVMARAERFAALLPGDGRAPVLAEAMRVVAMVSWGDATCDAMLNSPQGLAQVVYLSLSAQEREKTSAEAILDGIDAEFMVEVQKSMLEAAGISREDVEKLLSKPPEAPPDPRPAPGKAAGADSSGAGSSRTSPTAASTPLGKSAT